LASAFASAQTRKAKPPSPPALKSKVADTDDSTPSKATTKTTVADDDVITVDTNLVTTPVTVVDRNGRFIPGLKKKDFKISENGVLQKITYFQSEEQPFTVILMIDASPSTRYKMDEIHYAALTFINQLRPTDKVMVVAFDSRPTLLTPEPTTDRGQLYAAIYKAEFGSGTGLYDAVEAVADLDPIRVPGRKAIVLFTDGVDTTSRRASFESTIADVEEIDALIYPIRYNTMYENGATRGLTPVELNVIMGAIARGSLPASVLSRGGGRGQSVIEYEKGKLYLQSLADRSGGRMFEADSITDLDASFAGIAQELRQRYSVGYYPVDTGTPGERRQIKIQVARPRAVVRAKTSYVIKEG
jgi:VWFA-related protein